MTQQLVVVYYEPGCPNRFLTQYLFDKSNSSLQQTSELCVVSRADVIGSTYTFYRTLGLCWTVPALIFSYYTLYSRLRPALRQVQGLKELISVVLSRIDLLLLLNANIGIFGMMLWSIDPDFARYSLGTVVIAFIRQVGPMAMFNGGVLYLYTFQSTLNSLYSQTSEKEKYFAISSSSIFVICMIIDAFFDIAQRKTAVPELIWATGYFVFITAVVFYGLRVTWKFCKTSVGSTDVRKSSARPVFIKLMLVISGLTFIGSGFFWTLARYGWYTVLHPNEPPFGTFVGATAEQIRARFTFLVGLFNAVGIVIVPMFFSTFLSWTCCTRRAIRNGASKATNKDRSAGDVELAPTVVSKLPGPGSDSRDVPESVKGDPTSVETAAT